MEEKDGKSMQTDREEPPKPGLSRRDFLKGVGVSGVAAAVITTVPSPHDVQAAGPPKGVRDMVIQTEINGRSYRMSVKSHWTLLDVLRKN